MPVTSNEEELLTTPESSALETVTTDSTLEGNGTADSPLHISVNFMTYVNNKQNKLTFDTTPQKGSKNPVTSDGILNYVASQVTGAIHIVGASTPDGLSLITPDEGDTYVMTEDGVVSPYGAGDSFYVTKGSLVTFTARNQWLDMGNNIDLTIYAKKSQLPSIVAGANTVVTETTSDTGAIEYQISVVSAGATSNYPVSVSGEGFIKVTPIDTLDDEGAIVLRTFKIELNDTINTVVEAADGTVTVNPIEGGYQVHANLPIVTSGTIQTDPSTVSPVVSATTTDKVTTYSVNIPKICVVTSDTYDISTFQDGTLYFIVDED